MVLHNSAQRELDPLDTEIVERAFEAAWTALKASNQALEFESDAELEAALRRELIELARLNEAGDAETLRDIVLASLPSDPEAA
jgi:hypothetical protein